MSEAVVVPPDSRRLPWGGKILRAETGDPYAAAPAMAVKDKTARQALKAAGMDFTIVRLDAEAPAQSVGKAKMPKIGIGNKWFARRTDTGAVLGFLGPEHDLLQTREMAEFADLLVDTHESSLVGMGMTKRENEPYDQFGAKAFVVVKLDEPIRPQGMPEEATDVFLFCSNAWDSSQSFTASIVPYKLACTNGLRYPLKDGIQTWRIRHDRMMRAKMQVVQESIQSLAGWSELLRVDMEKLIETPVIDDHVDKVVKALLPNVKPEKDAEGKIKNAAAVSRRENQQDAFLDVWINSGTIAPAVRMTAYGALQSYAEWHQWARPDLRMDPLDRLLANPADSVLASARTTLGRLKLS